MRRSSWTAPGSRGRRNDAVSSARRKTPAMTHKRKVGRNERCPCGSGKKFKQCCEAATTRGADRKSRVLLVALVSIVATAIVFGIASVARNGNSGGAGPRQVWSPEHGHYHTVP
ncbi:MAG: SEC-C domain-containing protein [Acidobacteria bacterium]|nr:SEC-C domain-containing protein [Acidobacteriota bacterium]